MKAVKIVEVDENTKTYDKEVSFAIILVLSVALILVSAGLVSAAKKVHFLQELVDMQAHAATMERERHEYIVSLYRDRVCKLTPECI